MLRSLLTIICFFLSNYIVAQFSGAEIAEILRKANGELTAYGQLDINENNYLVQGDSILINPQGRHLLFSYHKDRGTFVRIDRSEFHGHNFGRKWFLHKGEIYAFGGYGFWQTHGKLIHFSKNTREWEFVAIKGIGPTGMPAISFVKGDSLYGLFPIEKHPERDIDSIGRMAYIINLNTFECTPFRIATKKVFDFYRPAWNDQFSTLSFFGINGIVTHVVDKESLRIYTSHTTPNLFRGYPQLKNNALDSNFLVVEGEKIKVYPKNNPEVVYSAADFLGLYFTSVSINDMLIPIKPATNWYQKFWLWLVMGIVLFLLIMFWLFGKSNHWIYGMQKHRWQGVYRSLKHEPYYADIRSLSSGIYTEKEIDIALRIAHFSLQIRKLKRSIYLEELNRMQPGFIEILPAKNLLGKPSYQIFK